MSTAVKYFHSGMPGAARGNAGSAGITTGLSIIIRQCLVTGFNSRTATSSSIFNGVVTVNFGAAHGFEAGCVVLVAGATPSSVNGEKRVLSVTADAITFATTESNGTVTGTVTVSFAPAGWVEPFAGGSDAYAGFRTFRSSDPTSTGISARTYSDSFMSNLRSVQVPTSVSAGAGESTLVYGYVNGTNNANSGPWVLIADSKTCYFFQGMSVNGVTNGGAAFSFGDFKSFSTADAYCFFTVGHTQNAAANSPANTSVGANGDWPLGYLDNGTAVEIYAARSASGAPGSIKLRCGAESYTAGATAGMSGALTSPMAPTYPNTPNNSLLLSRLLLSETGIGARGFLRGLYVTPHNNHAAFSQLQRVQGQGSFAGRTLMAVKPGPSGTTASHGLMFVDITGPWE